MSEILKHKVAGDGVSSSGKKHEALAAKGATASSRASELLLNISDSFISKEFNSQQNYWCPGASPALVDDV